MEEIQMYSPERKIRRRSGSPRTVLTRVSAETSIVDTKIV